VKFPYCMFCKIACIAKASESPAGQSLHIKKYVSYDLGPLDIRK
jgi:hypothetical protein